MWTQRDIPNQAGRLAVITGANTGIGFETAQSLATAGAQVVLACRSATKGTAALERIKAKLPGAQVTLEALDLADLTSVDAFAQRFFGSHAQLDLLILNAGVMVPPATRTAQGFELQFGVNHLAHFALAGKLLPRLMATPGARIVVVSSAAAARGAMDFDDLQFEKRGYAPWKAYAQSKLANQLFASELQRRLQAAGSDLRVTAAHPGWTATDLQRSSGLMRLLNRFFAQSAAQGALPTLRAATDPEAAGGDYFGPRGFMQMRGAPVRVSMVKAAQNAADAARLWQESEALSGVHYALPSG